MTSVVNSTILSLKDLLGTPNYKRKTVNSHVRKVPIFYWKIFTFSSTHPTPHKLSPLHFQSSKLFVDGKLIIERPVSRPLLNE